MCVSIYHVSFSFLCSTFFTNANMGACVAALVYFLLFFLQIVIQTKIENLNVPIIAILVSISL